MTPKLAQAVDPILMQVLDLLHRIERGEDCTPQDERIQIIAMFEQAGAMFGGGEEWELCRYALVAWIDEMLVESSWSGQSWWSNHVLEVEMFNTRLCNEQFFVRSQEAARLSHREVLEVYYVCVMLGFRGFYRDENSANILADTLQLPQDLETWSKQTAMSIRLGQGRPALGRPGPEIRGASPQGSVSVMIWSCFAVVVLTILNGIFFFSIFG